MKQIDNNMNETITCECGTLYKRKFMKRHLTSQTHTGKTRQQQIEYNTNKNFEYCNEKLLCSSCDNYIQRKHLAQHNRTQKHIINVSLQLMKGG
jgi:uncharacterized protein YaiI (UPF0178 family)